MLHTFVICAYQKSEYLEDCINSLIDQTTPSRIIMVTHTPNEYLQETAEKYHITLYVNHGEGGITQDWNFGLQMVHTQYATIAHQDDIYEPEYTRHILSRMVQQRHSIIGFSDYTELRENKKVYNEKMLKIKRLMLFPLRARMFQGSRFVRRRILSLGDPIDCPSVMYNMKEIELPIFCNHFICAEDWEAWEKLSRQKGKFIYISEPLMSHRIHEESTTTKTLENGGRVEENFEMYRKFWPKGIARFINHFYTASEKSNDLSS